MEENKNKEDNFFVWIWPTGIELIFFWINMVINTISSASGWSIIAAIILICFYTGLFVFAGIMTLWAIQSFCNYIYVENVIFKLTLATILPFPVFVILISILTGSIPALFDPIFIDDDGR